MYYAQNAMALAEVMISKAQRPGAGAKMEVLKLVRAHFLGSYWYLS